MHAILSLSCLRPAFATCEFCADFARKVWREISVSASGEKRARGSLGGGGRARRKETGAMGARGPQENEAKLKVGTIEGEKAR
jgi:hypothetical protein